ncbi:UDP-glucose--hexose-1-phosphate uridylyltransferase [Erwinia sp. CPCC 100877]|nr:UDP-glucose--hexose-1-phosphate uridylyltransferase [Erwinia sp. CPCC 100877]
MSISETITDFATLAIQAGGWMELDRVYLQNRLLAMVGEETMVPTVPSKVSVSSQELVAELIRQAQENGVVAKNTEQLAMLEAQLMDFLTPPPSVVNAFFAKHYDKAPAEATNYFYTLNKNNNYIHTVAMDKTNYFTVPTAYGELEVLVQPVSFDKTQSQYPKCELCMENEGYLGRKDYPARTNQRIIRMNLDGESWGFHYAPVAYYNEQAIISAEKHQPMSLNQDTFRRLMRIIEVLPHYFVGAETDLPQLDEINKVHEHYQAGRKEFPLAKAEVTEYFELADYPLMNAGIVNWPLSVIRLQSPNKEDLISAGTEILNKWRDYSDDAIQMQAVAADGTPYHSLMAIARRKELLFELDLVLCDASKHSTFEQIHFQSKRQLGLMEVMGTAVVTESLAANQNEQAAVGQQFLQALTHAAAFEPTASGQVALKRFIATL